MVSKAHRSNYVQIPPLQIGPKSRRVPHSAESEKAFLTNDFRRQQRIPSAAFSKAQQFRLCADYKRTSFVATVITGSPTLSRDNQNIRSADRSHGFAQSPCRK